VEEEEQLAVDSGQIEEQWPVSSGPAGKRKHKKEQKLPIILEITTRRDGSPLTSWVERASGGGGESSAAAQVNSTSTPELTGEALSANPVATAADRCAPASTSKVAEVRKETQCVEHRSDGRRCLWPVMEGRTRCQRHEMWFDEIACVMGMPFPEDALSLQNLMAVTISLMLKGTITPQKANAIANICRVMRQNVFDCKKELEHAETEMTRVFQVTRIQ